MRVGRVSPANGDVLVRRMMEADLAQVVPIEAASFSDAWPLSAFVDLLRREYARLWVAVSGELVLGYCVLLRAADEGEIANICAAPSARGRGIGGQLLDTALAAADGAGAAAVYLEVRVSNAPARALYERRGFLQVGRRRGYYAAPAEDALVLKRTNLALIEKNG